MGWGVPEQRDVNQIFNKRKCKYCGKEFVALQANQQYCRNNNVCKNKYAGQKSKKANLIETIICEKCSKEFRTKLKRKQCSKCYEQGKRQALKEAREYAKGKLKTSCGDCRYCYPNLCRKVATSGKEYYLGSRIHEGIVTFCPRFKRDTRRAAGDDK